MGIEPFLLSSSLLAVMAQRLVRLLCEHCKEPFIANAAEREILGVDASQDEVTLHRGQGCERCNYTGYRGRTGIYELIEIDDNMRQMIYEGAGEQDMLRRARQDYPGIDADGRSRVLAGKTSLEELLRVTAVG
jgi:general secretion pathway protein E